MSVIQLYDDKGEESELYSMIIKMMVVSENVYMEMGVQAGFLLAKDLFSTVK